MLAGVYRRLSSSVTLHGGATYKGAARDGGPVVLRPVRATPCSVRFERVLSGGLFNNVLRCLRQNKVISYFSSRSTSCVIFLKSSFNRIPLKVQRN